MPTSSPTNNFSSFLNLFSSCYPLQSSLDTTASPTNNFPSLLDLFSSCYPLQSSQDTTTDPSQDTTANLSEEESEILKILGLDDKDLEVDISQLQSSDTANSISIKQIAKAVFNRINSIKDNTVKKEKIGKLIDLIKISDLSDKDFFSSITSELPEINKDTELTKKLIKRLIETFMNPDGLKDQCKKLFEKSKDIIGDLDDICSHFFCQNLGKKTHEVIFRRTIPEMFETFIDIATVKNWQLLKRIKSLTSELDCEISKKLNTKIALKELEFLYLSSSADCQLPSSSSSVDQQIEEIVKGVVFNDKNSVSLILPILNRLYKEKDTEYNEVEKAVVNKLEEILINCVKAVIDKPEKSSVNCVKAVIDKSENSSVNCVVENTKDSSTESKKLHSKLDLLSDIMRIDNTKDIDSDQNVETLKFLEKLTSRLISRLTEELESEKEIYIKLKKKLNTKIALKELEFLFSSSSSDEKIKEKVKHLVSDADSLELLLPSLNKLLEGNSKDRNIKQKVYVALEVVINKIEEDSRIKLTQKIVDHIDEILDRFLDNESCKESSYFLDYGRYNAPAIQNEFFKLLNKHNEKLEEGSKLHLKELPLDGFPVAFNNLGIKSYFGIAGNLSNFIGLCKFNRSAVEEAQAKIEERLTILKDTPIDRINFFSYSANFIPDSLYDLLCEYNKSKTVVCIVCPFYSGYRLTGFLGKVHHEENPGFKFIVKSKGKVIIKPGLTHQSPFSKNIEEEKSSIVIVGGDEVSNSSDLLDETMRHFTQCAEKMKVSENDMNEEDLKLIKEYLLNKELFLERLKKQLIGEKKREDGFTIDFDKMVETIRNMKKYLHISDSDLKKDNTAQEELTKPSESCEQPRRYLSSWAPVEKGKNYL